MAPNPPRARRPTPPELRSRDWLLREYVLGERTSTDIGRELDCDGTRVTYWLHKHDLPVRGKGRPPGVLPAREVIELVKKEDIKLGRAGTPLLFRARAGGVLKALKEADKVSLRGSLLDLAALCEAWANRIATPEHPLR
ncbi:MAG: hypothetical protein E4G90_03615 [Gemmatimonadales bacterium]|jgi:hypothetical protein|nr:MAG: hypothetical protein E4G90_03615 [Gemmatimonadales bacterium]